MAELIKVHVNEEQRSFLEFLVRRYKADTQDLLNKPGRVNVNREVAQQLIELSDALIHELSQAGT